MTSRSRGRLPAHVYWRRRLMVLGTVLLLVFAVGRLLVGGDDATPTDGAVTPAAGVPTSQTTAGSDPAGEGTAGGRRDRGGRADEAGKKDRKDKPEPLPVPSGPCADEDVVATPVVKHAVGGGDVTIGLDLTTIEAEACTWTASRHTLTLKITSGKDDIWASRECPRAVPTQDVVVYREQPTRVDVTWSGKRSEEDSCTRGTDWARPGWYHVVAAALAGEPSDTQFELIAPEAEHITKTIQPKPDKKGDRQD